MMDENNDERYWDVLERRARSLAEKSKTAERQKVESLVAVAAVGAERFGLPVEGLNEILRTPPLCRLPATPPWFAGIAHVRGQIISAVNLGTWFDGAGSSGAFLAVASGPQGPLGLLIDAILDFRDVLSSDIVERLNPDISRSIAAITQDLVRIIDIRHLLADPRLIIDSPPIGSFQEPVART